MQTEYRKNTLYFRKLYILFSKNRQNVPGTILFRAPNNIVCRLKQYSFTCQTQLFRARKSNLWKMKVKRSEFHSLEKRVLSINRKVIKRVPLGTGKRKRTPIRSQHPPECCSNTPVSINLYFANRPRRPSESTKSYFGARKGIVDPFV